MTKAYKEYKVQELKELLKERDLTTSGTKSELIARLEENDAVQGTSADAGETGEADSEAATAASAAPATEAASDASAFVGAPASEPATASDVGAVVDAEAAPGDDPIVPPEPPVTAEALISDLRKRIERNKRFGVDSAELESQVRRIERFGLTDYKPPKVDGPLRVGGNRGSRRSGRRAQNQNAKKQTGIVKN